MTPRPTPLFWPLSGADFTRAIKRSRSEINAVAAQIRGKLSQFGSNISEVNSGPRCPRGENSGPTNSLAGQTCEPGRLGVFAEDDTQAVPLHLGTKYLNTLIHAKPAARSGDLERNSADTPDRGRLGGNF